MEKEKMETSYKIETGPALEAGPVVEAGKAMKPEKVEEAGQSDGFGRDALQKFLGGYMESGLMAADFAELAPKARLEAVARLTAYVMPKLKSVDMDLGLKDEDRQSHDLGSLLDDVG